jgi:CheY-like chemotaxis protein
MRFVLVEDNVLSHDSEIFAKFSDAAQCPRRSTAEEALDCWAATALKPCAPLPEVILLDLNMPRMNGVEFLTELRGNRISSHSRCFITTTSSRTRTVSTPKLGVSGYILGLVLKAPPTGRQPGPARKLLELAHSEQQVNLTGPHRARRFVIPAVTVLIAGGVAGYRPESNGLPLRIIVERCWNAHFPDRGLRWNRTDVRSTLLGQASHIVARWYCSPPFPFHWVFCCRFSVLFRRC